MNKLKLFAFLVFANVLSISLSAQTFHEIFGVHGLTRSDNSRCARQTSDGGFIMIATEFYAISGYGDVLLVKTDASGDTLWSHVYSGPYDDMGNFVQQTTDGGYILIGSTQYIGQGLYDMWVIKTNANGDTLWTRTYGGPGQDHGTYIQQTDDGGYLVYGNSTSYCSGQGNAATVIKTDNAGIIQWSKFYDMYGSYGTATAIQTPDHGYMLQMLGYDVSGNVDVVLVKTDVNGDTTWTRKYSLPGDDVADGVVQTSDGGYVFAATTHETNGTYQDFLLVKVNSIGDTVWTRTFGGANAFDIAYSVQNTNDGGFIVAGESWSFSQYNSVYLVKTDGNGDLQWSRIMSGVAYRYALFASQNSDGSYIVAGTTSDWGTASGDYDAYLIRTDAYGYGYCADSDPATLVGYAPLVPGYFAMTVGTGSVQGSTAEPCYRNCEFEVHCASPLAIQEQNENQFRVSPNPSNGMIHISSDYPVENCSVQLYNLLGEKLSEEKINAFISRDFDFSGNATGIYFVKISDGKNVSTVKIILQ